MYGLESVALTKRQEAEAGAGRVEDAQIFIWSYQERARFVCQMDVSSGGANLQTEMEQAKEDEYNAKS